MAANSQLLDLRMAFLEASIHTVLFARQLYPVSLFEQRKFLGVTIWQSRHPDINFYIRRVLENSKEVLNSGVADKLIFTVMGANDTIVDQLSLKCDIFDIPLPSFVPSHHKSNNKNSNSSTSSAVSLALPPLTETEILKGQFGQLEAEFRSTLLALKLLDVRLPVPSQDCTWTLMLATKTNLDKKQQGVLTKSLTSGEWLNDTNKLPENITLQNKQVAGSSGSGSGSNGDNVGRNNTANNSNNTTGNNRDDDLMEVHTSNNRDKNSTTNNSSSTSSSSHRINDSSMDNSIVNALFPSWPGEIDIEQLFGSAGNDPVDGFHDNGSKNISSNPNSCSMNSNSNRNSNSNINGINGSGGGSSNSGANRSVVDISTLMSPANTKLLPVKTFRNELVNLAVYVHIYNHSEQFVPAAN